MRTYLVREIMSAPAVVIAWGASILNASALMQTYGIRRLPVVDDENVVIGVISLGDVREATSVYNTASPYAPDSDEVLLAVDEVMTAPALVVAADDTLRHVVQLMLDHKIGGVPVVDDRGRAVGMVTESDVFRLLLQLWEQTDQTLLQASPA
jgi:CBS domain-containing protein